MKKIISYIGAMRLRALCTIIGLVILFIMVPFALYMGGTIILLFCLIDIQFVCQQSEQLMLRLCYDKNNKYDVYMHILKDTWKKAYNSQYNDVLAFVLFDPVGVLSKKIPFTKVLSLQQQLMLNCFPELPWIAENQWVPGKQTSVMIMRKGHSYQYKNNWTQQKLSIGFVLYGAFFT